jgi:hypothetical protein
MKKDCSPRVDKSSYEALKSNAQMEPFFRSNSMLFTPKLFKIVSTSGSRRGGVQKDEHA